jgi:hypothetical protein
VAVKPNHQLQNDDARRPFRRKAKDMAEIAIERDECPPFPNAHIKNVDVRCTTKPLLANRQNVMTARAKKAHTRAADILIDLNLYTAGSIGTGMI